MINNIHISCYADNDSVNNNHIEIRPGMLIQSGIKLADTLTHKMSFKNNLKNNNELLTNEDDEKLININDLKDDNYILNDEENAIKVVKHMERLSSQWLVRTFIYYDYYYYYFNFYHYYYCYHYEKFHKLKSYF